MTEKWSRFQDFLLRIMTMETHPAVYMMLLLAAIQSVNIVVSVTVLGASYLFLESMTVTLAWGITTFLTAIAALVALLYRWWLFASIASNILLWQWTFVAAMIVQLAAFTSLPSAFVFVFFFLYLSAGTWMHHCIKNGKYPNYSIQERRSRWLQ